MKLYCSQVVYSAQRKSERTNIAELKPFFCCSKPENFVFLRNYSHLKHQN